MINVKKGTAHSLQQSDIRGLWDGSTTIVAGSIAYVDGTTGIVTKGAPLSGASGMLGFTINDDGNSDGDVKESGKIALYTLDGSSILETDQTENAITTGNYTIGAPLYAFKSSSANAGKVTVTASADSAGPIGWVEGIRSLQADGNATFASQNYPSLDSAGNLTTKAYVYKGQKNIPVLSIKLAAFNGKVAAAA